jgi:Tfp pilus assembly protein PilO
MRSWIPLLVLALLAIGYLLMFFLPKHREIESLRTELDVRREFILQTESQRMALMQLERELAATRQFCTEWREHAPHEATLASLFADIHVAAQGAGVGIVRFEPLAPVRMATIRQVPISLVATGSFAQISEAMLAIENLPATIWIEDVRLNLQRQDEKKVQWEAKLVVFTGDSEKSD